MSLVSSIENAGLALQVQATVQRKVLDHQAQNFLTLLESLKELSEEINGGRNDNLGKVVDVIA
jgi:hypothetical protein